MSLRLALVSDIHGNLAALEAALAEIEKAAPFRSTWPINCPWRLPTFPAAC